MKLSSPNRLALKRKAVATLNAQAGAVSNVKKKSLFDESKEKSDGPRTNLADGSKVGRLVLYRIWCGYCNLYNTLASYCIDL